MKRLLLMLFLLPVMVQAQSSTRTTTFKLEQWGTGDTLRAGAKNDSTQANYSLNNAFYRLEAILSRLIDGNGYFTGVTSPANTDLVINAGVGTQNRVSIAGTDSFSVGGNAWFYGGAGVSGTFQVVGNTTANNVTSEQNTTVYDTLFVGAESVSPGVIGVGNGASPQYRTFIEQTTADSDKVVTLPNRDGRIALQTANDSLEAPNVSYMIYNSSTIAADTNGAEVTNFPTWTQDGTSYKAKVQAEYIHKRGTKYVTAYFQAKVDSLLLNSGTVQLQVRTLAGASVGSGTSTVVATSWTSASISVDVSGLNSDGYYYVEVDLKHGDGAGYHVSLGALSIMAESL